jgi:hypothetical protein
MISPFSKGDFGVGLGKVILLFGMETIPRGCVFGGMGGRSLVVFQGRKVGVFSCFPKNNFLVVWDGVEKFFHNMMT